MISNINICTGRLNVEIFPSMVIDNGKFIRYQVFFEDNARAKNSADYCDDQFMILGSDALIALADALNMFVDEMNLRKQ